MTVDGKTAAPGMKVEDGQEIRVGKKWSKAKRTKKRSWQCTNLPGLFAQKIKGEKKNIIRFLNYPVRITYAGRLDKDSEGTSDHDK